MRSLWAYGGRSGCSAVWERSGVERRTWLEGEGRSVRVGFVGYVVSELIGGDEGG